MNNHDGGRLKKRLHLTYNKIHYTLSYNYLRPILCRSSLHSEAKIILHETNLKVWEFTQIFYGYLPIYMMGHFILKKGTCHLCYL